VTVKRDMGNNNGACMRNCLEGPQGFLLSPAGSANSRRELEALRKQQANLQKAGQRQDAAKIGEKILQLQQDLDNNEAVHTPSALVSKMWDCTEHVSVAKPQAPAQQDPALQIPARSEGAGENVLWELQQRNMFGGWKGCQSHPSSPWNLAKAAGASSLSVTGWEVLRNTETDNQGWAYAVVDARTGESDGKFTKDPFAWPHLRRRVWCQLAEEDAKSLTKQDEEEAKAVNPTIVKASEDATAALLREVEAFSSPPSHGGWEHLKTVSAVQVYTKFYGEVLGALATCFIAADPDEVYWLATSHEAPRLTQRCASQVVAQVEEGLRVTHITYAIPMIADREFIVAECASEGDDGAYLMSFVSVSHPKVPVDEKLVRGDIMLGGWHILPQAGGCKVIWMSVIDPQARLPSMVQKMTATAGAGTLQHVKETLEASTTSPANRKRERPPKKASERPTKTMLAPSSSKGSRGTINSLPQLKR